MIDGPDESVDGGKPRFSALISIYYCRASLPRRKGIKIHRSGAWRRTARGESSLRATRLFRSRPLLRVPEDLCERAAAVVLPCALYFTFERVRGTLYRWNERLRLENKIGKYLFDLPPSAPAPPALQEAADSLIDVQEFRGAINLTLYLAQFSASGIIKVMKISAARCPALVLARN